jgi:RNA polymerase-interacting CarD/CdnL/TRCF family regulator
MMHLPHMPQSWRCSHCLTGPMSAEQVNHVLCAAPCALPSDPYERSGLVAHKLQKDKPSRLAEIVRDLTWRQRRGLANARDVQLLQQATSALSAWLAAYRGIERARARERIRGIVERTVSLFADEMSDQTRLT